jgi:hypothetical protein
MFGVRYRRYKMVLHCEHPEVETNEKGESICGLCRKVLPKIEIQQPI